MADSPSWLTPQENAAPAMDVPIAAPKAAAASAAAPSSSLMTEQMVADEKELPGIILVMRLANMGVSIALMACSVSLQLYMLIPLPVLVYTPLPST